jgi:hypothetical protein
MTCLCDYLLHHAFRELTHEVFQLCYREMNYTMGSRNIILFSVVEDVDVPLKWGLSNAFPLVSYGIRFLLSVVLI